MTTDTHTPQPHLQPAPASTASPDSDLVSAARAGHREAFDLLVRRYLGLVHAVAIAHLRDRDAADDLSQETFLRAYLAIADLAQPERFGPWVARIARNLALDWLRAGRRRSRALPLVSLDDSAHGADQIADDRQKGALEQMQFTEETRALQAAIAALDPEDREIVLLHYAHDLPTPEIAARLGIHRATVRRRLDRAVATLRAALTADLAPALRRAASPLRPAPALETTTLAVVGAVALLSTPAKAALLAQAGAAVAVVTATQSIAIAAAWHTILSGGFIMSLKTQVVAVLVLLVLIGGGAYFKLSQTKADPTAPILATAVPPTAAVPKEPAMPTAGSAPTSGTIGLAVVSAMSPEALAAAIQERRAKQSDVRIEYRIEGLQPTAMTPDAPTLNTLRTVQFVRVGLKFRQESVLRPVSDDDLVKNPQFQARFETVYDGIAKYRRMARGAQALSDVDVFMQSKLDSRPDTPEPHDYYQESMLLTSLGDASESKKFKIDKNADGTIYVLWGEPTDYREYVFDPAHSMHCVSETQHRQEAKTSGQFHTVFKTLEFLEDPQAGFYPKRITRENSDSRGPEKTFRAEEMTVTKCEFHPENVDPQVFVPQVGARTRIIDADTNP